MSQLTETFKRLLEEQLAREIAAGGNPFEVASRIADRALGAKGIMELMGHEDAKDMQLVALYLEVIALHQQADQILIRKPPGQTPDQHSVEPPILAVTCGRSPSGDWVAAFDSYHSSLLSLRL